MTVTLGKNITSLRTIRGLQKSSGELRSVYDRLATGQRINRASDDAAGLSIADGLKAHSRVFAQGVRNLNDGLSLLTIADAALENLSDIVVRLQELAEQAANGVYSSKQRQALDAEAQSLAEEFSRIQKSTEFNGVKLLTSELSSVELQAGIGQDAILKLGVGDFLGSGTFDQQSPLSLPANGPKNITAADFNGDGNLDIAITHLGNDTVGVYLGHGDGNFSASTSLSIGSVPIGINSADFNGDGIFDLAAVSSSDGTLSIYLGEGDGNFTTQQTVNVGSIPWDVVSGDLNNDGNIDLVTIDALSSEIHILSGDGSGGFTITQTYASPGTPRTSTLADFDSDGNLDLVTTSSNLAQLSYRSGNGDGTFGAATALSAGTVPWKVAHGDINGDGNLDLVTTNFGSDSVGVFLGQGNGQFSAQTSYNLVSVPREGLIVQDFNGDGYSDVMVNSFTTGAIKVALGSPSGTLEPGQTFSAGGVQLQGLVAGDFNNDGLYDAISSDGSLHKLEVLLGHASSGTAPLIDFSLATSADAKQALSLFKNKHHLLSSQRSIIGSYQSRIEVAKNALTAQSEQYVAAESRIRDADIALETAELVRLQILQQAAASILGQANQQPTLALQLLSRS